MFHDRNASQESPINQLKVPQTVHHARTLSQRMENRNSAYGSLFYHQLEWFMQSNNLLATAPVPEWILEAVKSHK